MVLAAKKKNSSTTSGWAVKSAGDFRAAKIATDKSLNILMSIGIRSESRPYSATQILAQ